MTIEKWSLGLRNVWPNVKERQNCFWMWKKKSSSWENGNHNGGEWRKVISTLARIILEPHSKLKKRNSSILVLMQQTLLTYHCREYKMDILKILAQQWEPHSLGKQLFVSLSFKTKHNYKVLVEDIKMCHSNISDLFP